jgi:hypothetical protein
MLLYTKNRRHVLLLSTFYLLPVVAPQLVLLKKRVGTVAGPV